MSQPIKAQYLTLGLRYEILHDVESFQILSATEFKMFSASRLSAHTRSLELYTCKLPKWGN